MKTDIHPQYTEVTVTCVCGHSFKTRSTMGKDFHVEICSECHPFFTGKQKLVDTAGRVDRFRRKYEGKYATDIGKKKAKAPAAPAAEAPKPEVPKPEAAVEAVEAPVKAEAVPAENESKSAKEEPSAS